MNGEHEYETCQMFFCFNHIFSFIVVGMYLSKQLKLRVFTIVNKEVNVSSYYYFSFFTGYSDNHLRLCKTFSGFSLLKKKKTQKKPLLF